MGTIEFKINGQEIVRITYNNMGYIKSGGDKTCEYQYEVYGYGEDTVRGKVTHNREFGVLALSLLIIKDTVTQMTGLNKQ